MNQYTVIQRLNLLRSLKLIRKARRNIVEKIPWARSDDIGQMSLGYLHNRDQPWCQLLRNNIHFGEKNESPALFAFNSGSWHTGIVLQYTNAIRLP